MPQARDSRRNDMSQQELTKPTADVDLVAKRGA
jgi:hypothetical protein